MFRFGAVYFIILTFWTGIYECTDVIVHVSPIESGPNHSIGTVYTSVSIEGRVVHFHEYMVS